MKFSVTVTLKKDVLDPQGKVVENTLVNMGMNKLKSISPNFSLLMTKKSLKKFQKDLGKAIPRF